VSYAAPTVKHTSGCTDDHSNPNSIITYDCPRSGSAAIITVTGNNFGPDACSILVGGVIATPVKLADHGNAGTFDSSHTHSII
jgi:hypothetical protein